MQLIVASDCVCFLACVWLNLPAPSPAAGCGAVAQWVANFFVSEARKNSHSFTSAAAEQAALMYNYRTTFTGKAGSGFEEEYIWPQEQQQ